MRLWKQERKDKNKNHGDYKSKGEGLLSLHSHVYIHLTLYDAASNHRMSNEYLRRLKYLPESREPQSHVYWLKALTIVESCKSSPVTPIAY